MAAAASAFGAHWLGHARAERDAARSELAMAQAAVAKAQRDHAALVKQRDGARDRRESAESVASRQRKQLAGQKSTEQKAEEDAQRQAHLAEADLAMRLTTGFLRDAEQAAVTGGDAGRKAFRAALDEANRLLEFQDVKRGGTATPEMNLLVGSLLLRHGPPGAAAGHFERAVAAGESVLTPAERVDATIGAARARLHNGEFEAARTALAALPAPATPDVAPSPMQRLALAEVRGATARGLNRRSEAQVTLQERLALARQVAGDDPRAPHAAALALAAHFHQQGDFDEAEALLRPQLQQDEAAGRTKAAFMTRLRLAWVLLDRGRADEGGQLNSQLRSQLALGAAAEELFAEPDVSEYLLARRAWPLAEQALEVQWKRGVDPATSPLERERIAARLVDVYEATARPELAVTWKRTLDQLVAARTIPKSVGGTAGAGGSR